MTRNVTVTVVTAPAVLPAGVSAGTSAALAVSLLNAADNSVAATQNLAAGVLVADFTGVADGDYVAQAVALDSTGADLGAVVQTPFTVADLLFNQPQSPLAVVVS